MYSDELKTIFANLKAGKIYGKRESGPRFPYFCNVLALSPGGDFIRWRCYGSSANKATLKDLNWIITVIFELSPAEFMAAYECLTPAEAAAI